LLQAARRLEACSQGRPLRRVKATEAYFMAALCNRAGHYIFALWFLSFFLSSSSSISFSSPNLSGRRLDVYHTSTHGVEFRIAGLNVLHAARWEYRTQKIAILAPSHNFVGLCLQN